MIISIFGSGLGLMFDQIFRIGTSELQIAGLAGENQFSNLCRVVHHKIQ
jgi:hypothetical protein